MNELKALKSLLTQANRLRSTAPVDDGFPQVMDEFCLAIDRANSAQKGEPDDSISVLAVRQFSWVERMGWHNKTTLEALALIASEVGEAVNECRGEAPTEKLGEELADIILRTIDLSEWLNINIAEKINQKMAINEARGTRGRII
ncbi:hypothetical protein [uncultured Gilvimarinus sp.]|uniref:hypothetical protein n=1 Tax=uncultured Gilvimarinus sp. TaxID=1689143 RepID=UPI0030D83AC2